MVLGGGCGMAQGWVGIRADPGVKGGEGEGQEKTFPSDT